MAVGEKKTDAQKVAELRKAAEDKTLPQAVRNTYLDRANEIERSGYEKMKMKEGMAKGGKVPASKKAKSAKPTMAVMIGLSPAKKMAKGGKVTAPIKEYGGKEKYPSEAAMMKHEKKEPKKVEQKEKKFALGGMFSRMANKAAQSSQTPPPEVPVAAPKPAVKTASVQERIAAQQAANRAGPKKTKPVQTQSNFANVPQASLGQPQIAREAAIQPTQEQNLALQKAYREAQQAKQMGLGMAKGGSVKKKPMKGIINKFV